MNLVIKKYSTPLITGLFLVSAISGTALFFHWQSGWFHSMHIWLSMVLLLPFFLHLWRNWSQFLLYFRNKSMLAACLLSFVAAGGFMLTSGHRGGNPAMRVFPVLTQAPLTDLAPLLHRSPDALVERLTHSGYTVHDTTDTLDQIAAASGQQASAILLSLLPQQQHDGDAHRHGNRQPS
ncbi:hypothetical protein [Acetobacter cerevisiae]|uniref:hypothetical protein n=1 Tax=Acetobacter cerevisiae TaxID=178900 RepID=UPI00209F2070|nr:hypothetical protein [Acetobacter cerevisiae]MCP1270865.1 hypothetical protein [Acetobacter cerevisiae]MCP1278802.1 hypothetical protein [Acetobacter cerevisiae]